MSFLKKTWLARLGEGLNRFRMNNSTDVVLESNPVSITQQGDQLSADNMNNLETRIGNAFDEMAGNLAPIEISPASTNHAVGTQLVYNGILYKVTSAISTGDNLVVGTNISAYPVSSALGDISAPFYSGEKLSYTDNSVLTEDVFFTMAAFWDTKTTDTSVMTHSVLQDNGSYTTYAIACLDSGSSNTVGTACGFAKRGDKLHSTGKIAIYRIARR